MNDAEPDPIVAPSAGPPVIVVSGAVVSTVNVREAGEASTLPTASIARTENVCSPSLRPDSARGEPHTVNAPPSSLHSKESVSSTGSPTKVNAADVVAIVEPAAGPPVITVSGGVVSTGIGCSSRSRSVTSLGTPTTGETRSW